MEEPTLPIRSAATTNSAKTTDLQSTVAFDQKWKPPILDSRKLNFVNETISAHQQRIQQFGRRTFIFKGKLSFGSQGKLQLGSFIGLFFPVALFACYEEMFDQGLQQQIPEGYWIAITLVFSLLTLYLFIHSSTSDPGFIAIPLSKKERRELPSSQKKGKQSFELRYCSTCDISRPLRTHHCRVCDLCVKERDHHCPFLNNCIGIHNRRTYLLFLVFASLLELVIIMETIFQIGQAIRYDTSFLSAISRASVILAALQLIYAVILGTNLLSLLLFQLRIAAKNCTADEFRRIVATNPKKIDIDLNREFDMGCLKNFQSIIFGLAQREPIYSYYEPVSFNYLKKRTKHYATKIARPNKHKDSNFNQEKNHINQKQQSKDIYEQQNDQIEKLKHPSSNIPNKEIELHSQNNFISPKSSFQSIALFDNTLAESRLIQEHPKLQNPIPQIESDFQIGQTYQQHHIPRISPQINPPKLLNQQTREQMVKSINPSRNIPFIAFQRYFPPSSLSSDITCVEQTPKSLYYQRNKLSRQKSQEQDSNLIVFDAAPSQASKDFSSQKRSSAVLSQPNFPFSSNPLTPVSMKRFGDQSQLTQYQPQVQQPAKSESNEHFSHISNRSSTLPNNYLIRKKNHKFNFASVAAAAIQNRPPSSTTSMVMNRVSRLGFHSSPTQDTWKQVNLVDHSIEDQTISISGQERLPSAVSSKQTPIPQIIDDFNQNESFSFKKKAYQHHPVRLSSIDQQQDSPSFYQPPIPKNSLSIHQQQLINSTHF